MRALLQQKQDQFTFATYIRHLWKPLSCHHINKTPAVSYPNSDPNINLALFLKSSQMQYLLLQAKILFKCQDFSTRKQSQFYLEHWVIDINVNHCMWLSLWKDVCLFAKRFYIMLFLSSCICLFSRFTLYRFPLPSAIFCGFLQHALDFFYSFPAYYF